MRIGNKVTMAEFHVVQRKRKKHSRKNKAESSLTERIITIKNDLRLSDFYRKTTDTVCNCLRAEMNKNSRSFEVKSEYTSNDVDIAIRKDEIETNKHSVGGNASAQNNGKVTEELKENQEIRLVEAMKEFCLRDKHGFHERTETDKDSGNPLGETDSPVNTITNYSDTDAVMKHSAEERVQEIICYGLGNFSDSYISRYQLAFLLLLIEELDVSIRKCWVFDPKFSDEEIQSLQMLGFNIIKENEAGKRKCTLKTLFYMPHCGKALYNNLLWANWGTGLNNVVILGNSFTRMVDNTPERLLDRTAHYVLKIQPYVTELELLVTEKFEDVFNDVVIHMFHDLETKVPEQIWNDNLEPKYESDDPEIILD